MLSFGLFSGSGGTEDLINRALIWLPLAIVSLSLHEFGHAGAAVALGDPTPREQGRLTINPLAHLEPFGTLMMLFGPIGWAKPVEFNPNRIRDPRLSILVALAGPAMNLLLALVSAAILTYGLLPESMAGAGKALQSLFFLNVGLATFNLLPIPPLDGGHIWPALLPNGLKPLYYQILPWGMIILIVMILLPGTSGFLWALNRWVAMGILNLLP